MSRGIFMRNFPFNVFQNALAATAAPYPGQFSGYEAFPQYATAAATGKIKSNKLVTIKCELLE